MKCSECGTTYAMDTINGRCGLCNLRLNPLLIPDTYIGRWKMGDKSDDLNKILKEANNRARYRAKTEFPPQIVKFGRKVEAWFKEHDQEITLGRFKGTFITLAEAKLGFAGYINKIVPIIHTDAEFENLLAVLGYDVTDDDDDSMAVNILVCGDKAFDDTKLMRHVLRQLPTGSTIIECGMDEGAEFYAAQVGESLEYDVTEYACRKMSDFEEVFSEEEIDGVLIFHDNPKESKRVVAIAKLAKAEGIPVKTVKHRVELDEWIAAMFEEDDE